jgi:hypothetical protein
MVDNTDYLFEGIRESLPPIIKPKKLPKIQIGDVIEFYYISESKRNDHIPKLFYIMGPIKGGLFGINLNYVNREANIIINDAIYSFRDVLLNAILKEVPIYEYIASVAKDTNMSRRIFHNKELFVTYNLKNRNPNKDVKVYTKEEINNLIMNKTIKGI